MKPLSRQTAAAFTLLEIMLVVMIIALLAGSAIYFMKDSLGVAKDTKAESDIKAMATALMSYETMNGLPPSTEQGLEALVNKPTSAPQPRKWKKFMSEIPLDPWGNAYQYQFPAQRGKKDPYDLFSAGADRKVGTDDDIGNW